LHENAKNSSFQREVNIYLENFLFDKLRFGSFGASFVRNFEKLKDILINGNPKILVELLLKLFYQFPETIIVFGCGSLGWEWWQLENIILFRRKINSN